MIEHEQFVGVSLYQVEKMCICDQRVCMVSKEKVVNSLIKARRV